MYPFQEKQLEYCKMIYMDKTVRYTTDIKQKVEAMIKHNTGITFPLCEIYKFNALLIGEKHCLYKYVNGDMSDLIHMTRNKRECTENDFLTFVHGMGSCDRFRHTEIIPYLKIPSNSQWKNLYDDFLKFSTYLFEKKYYELFSMFLSELLTKKLNAYHTTITYDQINKIIVIDHINERYNRKVSIMSLLTLNFNIELLEEKATIDNNYTYVALTFKIKEK